MQFDWRAISGPALTTATALIAILVDRAFIGVPDPAPLFICIVALAGSLSGLASGMICAGIAVACSAPFLLNHRATAGYDAAELVRLLMLATAAAGTAAVTGLLREGLMNALAWERRHHATAERLSAALDQVDIGIVLLDSDTRAEFINRAFRDYFMLPEEKADSKPPFIALMYHARDSGAYELPEEELSAFITRRTEMMRSGDFDADQHQPRGRTGSALQLHRVARRRTNAELHTGDRPRPPYRRPFQRRLLQVPARRRRSRPCPKIARRGIAA
jgi:PAS domain-containing protein